MIDTDHIKLLARRFNDGEAMEFMFFWGHQTTPGGLSATCLSQWYEAGFEIDGQHYPTAEHYMMASKALAFGDHATHDRVLRATSPGAAKALGRRVANFDDEVWTSVRFDIVVKASLAKFSQNPSLLAFLKATGSKVLVEASPVDRIWGIGMTKANPRVGDPNHWRGLNLLGFALMQAREML